MTFDEWWDATKSAATPETFAGWEHSCRQAWEAALNAAWLPMDSAPRSGVILLAVHGADDERRTYAAEASYDSDKNCWIWCITNGWTGWARLHSEWRLVGWRPLPAGPNV